MPTIYNVMSGAFAATKYRRQAVEDNPKTDSTEIPFISENDVGQTCVGVVERRSICQ